MDKQSVTIERMENRISSLTVSVPLMVMMMAATAQSLWRSSLMLVFTGTEECGSRTTATLMTEQIMRPKLTVEQVTTMVSSPTRTRPS
jgi:hypothetical protein